MPKAIVELGLLSGESFTVRLRWRATVGRLKEKIELIYGIKTRRQVILSLQGQVLANDTRLLDLATEMQTGTAHDPAVVSLTLLHLKASCSFCGTRAECMKHCAVCKEPYCCIECQRAHWNVHKTFCSPGP